MALENQINWAKNNKKILIVGGICFIVGLGIGMNNWTTMNNEKEKIQSQYNTLEKDSNKLSAELKSSKDKIASLEKKVEEAKPWFEMSEEHKKEEQAKLDAEKKAIEKKAEEEKVAKEKAAKEAELAKGVDTNKVKQQVEAIIKNELNDQVTNTKLDNLAINENSGTDSNKDVIVLGYLSWSTKNTEKTTKTMLKMYSDHLAAKIAKGLESGSEIALFWKAEYTGLDIKHSYVINNGNAYMQ